MEAMHLDDMPKKHRGKPDVFSTKSYEEGEYFVKVHLDFSDLAAQLFDDFFCLRRICFQRVEQFWRAEFEFDGFWKSFYCAVACTLAELNESIYFSDFGWHDPRFSRRNDKSSICVLRECINDPRYAGVKEV